PYTAVAVNFDTSLNTVVTHLRVDDVSMTQEDGEPVPPTLNATYGDGQVSLTWSGDYPGASSYFIWRAEPADGWPTILTNPDGSRMEVNGTSFTDTTVQNGHFYTYQITLNDYGSDVWVFSNKVEGTPGS